MRIALFGGTFDPPHRGHLGIAAAAADAFQLDTVLFTPVGLQPLKPNGASAPYSARLAMLSLACIPDTRFAVSELDAPHPDGTPNYTIQTLTALHELMPDAEFFNLAGADSFLNLPHWHEHHRLLELAQWIVVSRPGSPLGDLNAMGLTPHQQTRVHLLQTVHEDVAATNLRQRLETGDPCPDLLPSCVANYIETHHLYRNPRHAESPDLK
jgi:nicotinate-nucleotide adenylyltransferase